QAPRLGEEREAIAEVMQRVDAEDAIEARVGKRQVLGGAANQRYRSAGAQAQAGARNHLCRRLEADQARALAWKARAAGGTDGVEPVPRAAADLQHVERRSRGVCRAN